MKTVKFAASTYIGDPINAVRIFNEKEVDELMFLDIGATPNGCEPNFGLLEDIASEAFMPFGYGGGITRIEHVRRILATGVEKVVINSAAALDPELISAAADLAGSASVVVSIDVKRSWLGEYSVFVNGGRTNTGRDPREYASAVTALGAGEILLNAIDRDGTMRGYDLELIRLVSAEIGIPLVAVGGAGRLGDFVSAVDAGASAVGAGSLFVFHGPHRAVLITYPQYTELERWFDESSRRGCP